MPNLQFSGAIFRRRPVSNPWSASGRFQTLETFLPSIGKKEGAWTLLREWFAQAHGALKKKPLRIRSGFSIKRQAYYFFPPKRPLPSFLRPLVAPLAASPAAPPAPLAASVAMPPAPFSASPARSPEAETAFPTLAMMAP
jgi:hypothetical protein